MADYRQHRVGPLLQQVSMDPVARARRQMCVAFADQLQSGETRRRRLDVAALIASGSLGDVEVPLAGNNGNFRIGEFAEALLEACLSLQERDAPGYHGAFKGTKEHSRSAATWAN